MIEGGDTAVPARSYFEGAGFVTVSSRASVPPSSSKSPTTLISSPFLRPANGVSAFHFFTTVSGVTKTLRRRPSAVRTCSESVAVLSMIPVNVPVSAFVSGSDFIATAVSGGGGGILVSTGTGGTSPCASGAAPRLTRISRATYSPVSSESPSTATASPTRTSSSNLSALSARWILVTDVTSTVRRCPLDICSVASSFFSATIVPVMPDCPRGSAGAVTDEAVALWDETCGAAATGAGAALLTFTAGPLASALASGGAAGSSVAEGGASGVPPRCLRARTSGCGTISVAYQLLSFSCFNSTITASSSFKSASVSLVLSM